MNDIERDGNENERDSEIEKKYLNKNGRMNCYLQSVSTNFDEYITEMAKSRTYGTLLELRAMAYLYKRNILLYQSYDLGAWMVKEPTFQKPFLRIFYAPYRHFDSVFTKSFIVKAAFCQGNRI